MMRSNQTFAAVTGRKSHATHTPCEHQNWRSHGARETCDARRRVWMLLACCLGAAWALTGRCLGAAW
eukprot:9792186-Lingulodinium_polyedra.AAC.1